MQCALSHPRTNISVYTATLCKLNKQNKAIITLDLASQLLLHIMSQLKFQPQASNQSFAMHMHESLHVIKRNVR